MFHLKLYMRGSLLFTCIFLGHALSAQTHGFTIYPVSGNIESIEIVRLVDGTEQLVERTVFDNQNRIIEKQRKGGNSSTSTEQTFYTDSTAITYKCTCENTDELRKSFTPIGYRQADTPNAPSYFAPNQSKVEITKLDERGNPVEVTYYFEDGYIQSTAKMTYDAENHLLTNDLYDHQGMLFYYERMRYDERGNMVEKITKSAGDAVETKKYYSYDAENNFTEIKSMAGDRLSSHVRYFTQPEDTVRSHYIIHLLKGDTLLDKQVVLDKNQKEILSKTFGPNGSLASYSTAEYYDSGRVKKYSHHKADGALIREEFFEDDPINTCYQIIHHTPTSVKTETGRTTVTIPQIYLRKIRYRSQD